MNTGPSSSSGKRSSAAKRARLAGWRKIILPQIAGAEFDGVERLRILALRQGVRVRKDMRAMQQPAMAPIRFVVLRHWCGQLIRDPCRKGCIEPFRSSRLCALVAREMARA